MVFCLTGCYFGPEILEYTFCSASYNKLKKGFISIGIFQQVHMNVNQKFELLQACFCLVVISRSFLMQICVNIEQKKGSWRRNGEVSRSASMPNYGSRYAFLVFSCGQKRWRKSGDFRELMYDREGGRGKYICSFYRSEFSEI